MDHGLPGAPLRNTLEEVMGPLGDREIQLQLTQHANSFADTSMLKPGQCLKDEAFILGIFSSAPVLLCKVGLHYDYLSKSGTAKMGHSAKVLPKHIWLLFISRFYCYSRARSN